MTLSALTQGLRGVAEARDLGFAALVRRSGLDPRRDFRHASLAGADLRGEDLRDFDFRYADFEGARIHGARFAPPLSPRQRRAADGQGRAVAMFIGAELEAATDALARAMAPTILVPESLAEGLRRVGRHREQHYIANSLFLGDGQRAIARLLEPPFRQAQTALRTAAVALVFFQPTADFDFDTLAVTHRRIERAGRPHLTCVFPAFMDGGAGRRLFDVRIRTALRRPQDAIVFDPGAVGATPGPAAQGANRRELRSLLGWLRRLDSDRVIRHAPRREWDGDGGMPSLLHGAADAGGSLIAALGRALERPDTAYGSGNDARRRLFLPAGLAASADIDAVARLLEAFGRPVTVSAHTEVDGRADRFVLITAPESSAVWRLCGP